MIKVCIVCGKEFETDHGNRRLCGSIECKRKRQIEHNRKYFENVYGDVKKKQKKKKKGNLNETLRALNEYNAINGTKLTYGQFQEMRYLRGDNDVY